VAQLGARLDGIEEVVGSNPIGSTNFKLSLTTSYHVYIPPNKALGISRDCGERRFAHRSRIRSHNLVVSNNGCDILHIRRSREGAHGDDQSAGRDSLGKARRPFE
jgi:hypothetical protein